MPPTGLARRDFLAVAGAAALGATAAGPALAQTAETDIKILTVPVDVAAGPYYAIDTGIFKKYGLNASVTRVLNSASVIPALLNGDAQFGAVGTDSVAQAHLSGIPIVMVAPTGAYTSSFKTNALVVAGDSSIKTAADLVGKTVGVSGLRQLGELGLRAWLGKNGIDVSQLKLVEMSFPAEEAAIAAGKIDAAQFQEPFLSQALSKGLRAIAYTFDAIGSQWVYGAFCCSLSYARSNPAVVKNFAQAIADGDAWANKNGAEAWKIVDKYSGTTTPPGRQHVFYPERLRAADVQPIIDVAAKYGTVAKVFPAREVFAPGIGG